MISLIYRPSRLFNLWKLFHQRSSTRHYYTSKGCSAAEDSSSSLPTYVAGPLCPASMTFIKAKGRVRRVLILKPDHIPHPEYLNCVLCHSIGYRVLTRHGTRRVRMATRERCIKIVSTRLPTPRYVNDRYPTTIDMNLASSQDRRRYPGSLSEG